MNKKTLAVGATALAVVLTAVACSDSDAGTTVATSTAPASASTPAEQSAAHNDADVMFAQMMIPHHSQVIEMSDLLLAKENIPAEVTELAEQIKAAQGPELNQLESWLGQWDEPTSMPEGEHDMPGMDGGMAEMEGCAPSARRQQHSTRWRRCCPTPPKKITDDGTREVSLADVALDDVVLVRAGAGCRPTAPSSTDAPRPTGRGPGVERLSRRLGSLRRLDWVGRGT